MVLKEPKVPLMFTYRNYITIVCSEQLNKYTAPQKEQILNYCDEYIAQYRKENPTRSNLPQMKYILLMAISKFESSCGVAPLPALPDSDL